MEIDEKIFYDKEACDALRDIVLNSPMSIKTALACLGVSTNIKRDADLIKRMSNSGASLLTIVRLLLFLND